MKIEPLSADHLDTVTDIESRDGDVKWSRAQFQKEFGHEMIRFFVAISSEVRGPTSDVEGRTDVLGYGGYRKADTEAQITNLVVRKASQCQGVGRRLLEFILDCASGEGCTSCTLEVRQSNAHAQALYRKIGFDVQGTRKKGYQNPEEDALLMEKKL